jgi:hypothetical protein
MTDRDSYTLQFVGELGPEAEAHIALAASRGYTVVTSEPMTRLTLSRPPVPPLAPGDLGYDASSHNWPLDHAAAKASGRKFVYLRASMGYPNGTFTGVDARFAEHRANAAAAGVMAAAYHYFIWNLDGRRQADHFYEACGRDFGELPPCVDVEPRDSDTPAVVDKWTSEINLVAFISRLHVLAKRVAVVYTNIAAWDRMTQNPEWLRLQLLWLAQWNDRPGQATALPPHAAFAWMHQYRVAEVGELSWHPHGRLDLNAYVGESVAPPPPPPEPEPLFRVRVLAAALNVRSAPGVLNPVVGSVLKDEILSVWEVAANGWYRIHQTDSRWISGSTAYTARV